MLSTRTAQSVEPNLLSVNSARDLTTMSQLKARSPGVLTDQPLEPNLLSTRTARSSSSVSSLHGDSEPICTRTAAGRDGKRRSMRIDNCSITYRKFDHSESVHNHCTINVDEKGFRIRSKESKFEIYHEFVEFEESFYREPGRNEFICKLMLYQPLSRENVYAIKIKTPTDKDKQAIASFVGVANDTPEPDFMKYGNWKYRCAARFNELLDARDALLEAQAYFFTDLKSGTLSILMGTCFMFLWYLGSITQIVMAVNRLVVIYFRRSDVFTRYNIAILFSGIVPACLFLAYMAQYGFVCCSFIFDHVVLSYSYNHIGDLENYPNLFIDLPLNTFSSTTALICYLIIVWTVRKSTRGIASTIQRPQKNREVVYAMQFCVISILYTFSWITFRLFPVLIGNSRPEWFIFISIAVTVNNSANAIIYLISNQEVLRNLKSSGLFSKASNSQTLAIT